jgi:GNAT superfamily N-acetyltransferase
VTPQPRRTLELPDEPRWVEANALLASGEAWQAPAGAGVLLGHDGARLMIATGDADASEVASQATARTGWTLLAAPERDDLRAALVARGWWVEAARLFTLPDPDGLPDDDGVAALPAGAPLEHLPPLLAAEIAMAEKRTTVWTAVVDDAPVSFAYAPWRSHRWFDVSVDTAPGFRQLGLATRVASALIRAERAAGREPVWGAVESNAASLRLAARLGFVETDALWVGTAP